MAPIVKADMQYVLDRILHKSLGPYALGSGLYFGALAVTRMSFLPGAPNATIFAGRSVGRSVTGTE